MANSELAAGSIAYPQKFSKAQIRAIEALVDTFIPSIAVPRRHPDKSAESFLSEENSLLKSYYELSASAAGVPIYAAGLMHSKLKPDMLRIANLVLWLLSTRVGTYLLCGRASVYSKPPFFRSFAEIPLLEREELILSAWSYSPYLFFRTVFNAFKIFASYSCFTMVDEHGHNPTWSAIGYCGPDPKAMEHRRKAGKAAKKPLEGAVLDADVLGENLSLKLEEAGFEILEDWGHLASLWKQGKAYQGKVDKAIGVRCDAVVVGSGSGGGVAAAVLAKAGYKVLVIEKGKYLARDDLSLLEGPSMDRMYEGGGILPTDNANVLILAGATLGGGSAINWSASFKTPAHVLEEWTEEHGLTMFGHGGQYEDALQVVMTRLAVQSDPGEESWQNKLFQKGCLRLGFHVGPAARNSMADHACGWCGFGCWSGKKQATSETWLADAAANGAFMLTGAEAEAVLHRSTTQGKECQAVGVVATAQQGQRLLFLQSCITIVSCGSLNTPILLQRSGLRNPHIGKHLHLHPVQMMWGYFPDDPSSTDVAYDGGIITAVSLEVAKWHRGGHGCILQCPSLHPGVFSVLMPWLSGLDFKERMRRFSRTVHVFALARDHGVGTVRSSGPNGRILHYPLHPVDHQSLLDGGEAALRVLIASGASEVGTHHRCGDRLVITEQTTGSQVEEFLQRVKSRGIEQLGTPLCSAHQMGSCRMGIDPSTSAVDPTGETWEATGLFVADASIFPTAIGINPMITIQAISYCVAHMACRGLRRG